MRQDHSRALRYLLHTADELRETEPAGITRAFVEAVRSGAIWQRVAAQPRASTAAPIDQT